jgi:ubiquinone/menaquinone biosynthesis C-methylase UbiE
MLNKLGYDLLSEHRQAVRLAGLSAAGPVLDVATGSGRMLLALVEAGHQVISGDISEDVVNETRERLGPLVRGSADFRVLDAMRLDLADADLASVVTANAMHHMEEPLRVLEEMTRVLKSDGTLLLVEFNEQGFDVIDQVHRSVHGQPHSRGRISASEIDEFLQAHFKLVVRHVLALNQVWVAHAPRVRVA